ncbi:hypothetical protein [Nocardioides sp.]|uniref:hypothetical protein n=1 Tax=Nocardioides sp. TaxID=35761 RepID=UPI00260C9CC3|nr:hypothetical protein [Nocardioides sp.]MDI6909826.1 hypothetical protein [Nocardioides sp.]
MYTGAASTAQMFRAYDLVTVILVVPAFVVAGLTARRGPGRARLLVLSLLAYLVYGYGYYLFGTGFNDLFLLHAGVLATSVTALVLQLTTVDLAAFTDRVQAGSGMKGAAVVLGLLAAALGGMWVYFALDNAITGDVPDGSRLVETDTIVHLGIALDLTLLVPLYTAAAILLWRRTTWGFVLGVVAVVAGLLHQVGYIVAMPFQVAADIPGAVSYDPGEPVVVLAYLLAAVLLLRPTSTDRVRHPAGIR